MSDSNNPAFPDFGKLVPGFDFLQNLTRQASSAAKNIPSMPSMPSMGNWVAPTLNVEELDKRIQELKAVQFWLDQNATALKATVQALEVQKMTLATLQGMNVSMNQMAEAFTVKSPEPESKPHSFEGLEVPETSYQKKAESTAKTSKPSDAKAAPDGEQTAAVPGVIDPLQWWGALTQQFQTIANSAMKEVASRPPVTGLDEGLAQGMKAAGDMAEQASRRMAESVGEASDMVSSALRGAPAWPVPGKTAAPKKPASRSTAGASKKAPAKGSAKASAKSSAKTAKTPAKTGAKTSAARKSSARNR